MTTYMLQFHDIANMTKQIPECFPLKQKQMIKNFNHNHNDVQLINSKKCSV
jgi:hypothetical protein